MCYLSLKNVFARKESTGIKVTAQKTAQTGWNLKLLSSVDTVNYIFFQNNVKLTVFVKL
jgi:hypothetical protein